MSRRNLAAQAPVEQPTEQKQRANIYTVMLILAFAAICLACVLLYLELRVYAPDYWKTRGINRPTVSSLVLPLREAWNGVTVLLT